MKRIIIIALLFSAFTPLLSAQREPGERIKVFRAEVYARVLRLTPDEAQNFWPIFNEYTDTREGLQKKLQSDKQLDGMNDAEVEEYIKSYFELRQREFDLEKDLVQKLRKVLPSRKIAKLPMAERVFREALVKRLQERQERKMERRAAPNSPRGNK